MSLASTQNRAGLELESEVRRGRCERVYRVETEQGPKARKVFTSPQVGGLIHTMLTGAPIAYRWCPAAAEAAFLRRRVLAPLLTYWFGTQLRMADAIDFRWNDRARAFELDCEFARGRHAALCQPFVDATGRGELATLRQEVMPALQRRLKEAGFAGLLWQAGEGNSAAVGNFVRLDHSPGCQEDDKGGDPGADGSAEGRTRWVWINTESTGLSGLFSMGLLKACRGGQSLLNEVDVSTLHQYLHVHAAQLRKQLGAQTVDALTANVVRLAEVQTRWKGMTRLQRSVRYQRSQGRISEAQAAYFLQHGFQWKVRRGVCGAGHALGASGRALGGGLAWMLTGAFLRPGQRLLAFVLSPAYRAEVARSYATRRVESWRMRGQLSGAQAEALHSAVQDDDTTSTCLSDFAVHVAMKPAVKAVNWLLLPALLGTGMISLATLALIVVFSGAIGRTLYTLARIVTTMFRRQQSPWTALAVGMLPSVGNFAFVCELLVRGAGRQDYLAQLLIYDAASQLACRVPVGGGHDTGVEHLLNWLADRVVHPRGRTPYAGEVVNGESPTGVKIESDEVGCVGSTAGSHDRFGDRVPQPAYVGATIEKRDCHLSLAEHGRGHILR